MECRRGIAIESPRSLLLQINSPFFHYKSWNDSKAGSAIGPLDRLGPFGNFRAETAWMRHDPDSAQIESIRVPTGLDRHVRMIALVRVAVTSLVKQAELTVVEIKHATSKFGGKLSRPWTMLGIGHFVDPPRVVQDGEQGDDFDIRSRFLGQSQAIFENPCPVRNAVIAAKWQGVIFEDDFKDGFEVHSMIVSYRTSESLSHPFVRCVFVLGDTQFPLFKLGQQFVERAFVVVMRSSSNHSIPNITMSKGANFPPITVMVCLSLRIGKEI